MFDFEEKLKKPEVPAQVEEPMDAETLAQAEGEIQLAEAEFEALQVEEQTLLAFGTAVETKLATIDTESLTQADVESFRAYVTGAAAVIGISTATVGMDTESEIVDPAASFAQDVEGLKDFAKKAWELIKKMVAKFSNMVRKVAVKIVAVTADKSKKLEALKKEIEEGDAFESIVVDGGAFAKTIYGQAVVQGKFDEKGVDAEEVLSNLSIPDFDGEKLVKSIQEAGEDGWLGKAIYENTSAVLPKELEKGIDKKSKDSLKGKTFYTVRIKPTSVVGITVTDDGKVAKASVKLEKIADEVMVKTLDSKAAVGICDAAIKVSKSLKGIAAKTMSAQDEVGKLMEAKENGEEELTSDLKAAFNIAPYVAFQSTLAAYDSVKTLEAGVTFSMKAKPAEDDKKKEEK